MCATYWLGDNIEIEVINLLIDMNGTYSDEDTTSFRLLTPGDVYPKSE